MDSATLPKKTIKQIGACVDHFRGNWPRFETLRQMALALLTPHEKLRPFIHSIRSRVKDPDRLQEKLILKAMDALENSEDFDIVPENLFSRITDLAGVRVLHLHTHQMTEINPFLLDMFETNSWDVTEGPVANTWDDEYRTYFESIGIETQKNTRMYTSVHYLVRTNPDSLYSCELQVRTLVEEVWGEVSHTIDYPRETSSVACREQLRALARVSSGCGRLVDSIFKSHTEHIRVNEKIRALQTKKRGKITVTLLPRRPHRKK
jgi:ppGpp synthetase/RelA/SpoT-type nucleotidyltranferase